MEGSNTMAAYSTSEAMKFMNAVSALKDMV